MPFLDMRIVRPQRILSLAESGTSQENMILAILDPGELFDLLDLGGKFISDLRIEKLLQFYLLFLVLL